MRHRLVQVCEYPMQPFVHTRINLYVPWHQGEVVIKRLRADEVRGREV
jgi:hypothetical protein